jgi:hypothetical protein
MTSAMHWLRTRQRSHTSAILVVFVLAWLQAAVVPCAMAHDSRVEASESRTMPHHRHDCHGTTHGPSVDDSASGQPSGHATARCPYCPPAAGGDHGNCDHAAGCAFPHDPRIDARALSPLLGPPPSLMPGAVARPDSATLRVATGDLHDAVPHRSLSDRYCRYLE